MNVRTVTSDDFVNRHVNMMGTLTIGERNVPYHLSAGDVFDGLLTCLPQPEIDGTTGIVPPIGVVYFTEDLVSDLWIVKVPSARYTSDSPEYLIIVGGDRVEELDRSERAIIDELHHYTTHTFDTLYLYPNDGSHRFMENEDIVIVAEKPTDSRGGVVMTPICRGTWERTFTQKQLDNMSKEYSVLWPDLVRTMDIFLRLVDKDIISLSKLDEVIVIGNRERTTDDTTFKVHDPIDYGFCFYRNAEYTPEEIERQFIERLRKNNNVLTPEFSKKLLDDMGLPTVYDQLLAAIHDELV